MAKYEAMSRTQLQKMCRDSWLDDDGYVQISERLVDYENLQVVGKVLGRPHQMSTLKTKRRTEWCTQSWRQMLDIHNGHNHTRSISRQTTNSR